MKLFVSIFFICSSALSISALASSSAFEISLLASKAAEKVIKIHERGFSRLSAEKQFEKAKSIYRIQGNQFAYYIDAKEEMKKNWDSLSDVERARYLTQFSQTFSDNVVINTLNSIHKAEVLEITTRLNFSQQNNPEVTKDKTLISNLISNQKNEELFQQYIGGLKEIRPELSVVDRASLKKIVLLHQRDQFLLAHWINVPIETCEVVLIRPGFIEGTE